VPSLESALAWSASAKLLIIAVTIVADFTCRSNEAKLIAFSSIRNRHQWLGHHLALATFNVRQVSSVHVEMDGEIICVSPVLVRNRLIRPPKECSPSARRSYGRVFMGVRGHSRNDSRNVFVNCVLSRTYGNPANPVSCSKH